MICVVQPLGFYKGTGARQCVKSGSRSSGGAATRLRSPLRIIATKLILFPKYMKYHLLGHACT